MAKEHQQYKISGAQLKELWLQCMKYAGDFRIQYAGITKDFAVVTTKECVRHQEAEGNLLVRFDGHWKIVHRPRQGWPPTERAITLSSGWEQVIPTEVIWT